MNEMHDLVKLLTNDDRDAVDNPAWCLVTEHAGGPATLCTGEFFGFGESNCEYKTKTVKRGGITCPNCLAMIRWIKAIKL